jgi:tRNA U34 2-thiouridine synthase MnmA/TrmU
MGAGGFAGFLGDYIESRRGEIVTEEGKVIGEHKGLHTLTIGQGARISGAKERYFVAAKDSMSNRVIAVPGSNHPKLHCRKLDMASFTFISQGDGDGKMFESGGILAQIRHRQSAVPCVARMLGSSKVQVTFHPAISSVAEGQICALYHDRTCLGSGVITHVESGGEKIE